MKTNKLLFGAAYYSEYLPYDRIEQDMLLMERAGMNTIRIAESTWSTLEPEEGLYDFTHIDHMIEAAAQHHISVIVGTPTYAIPTWLMAKYPDILAITSEGPGRYGHRQNMDITHPGYRNHCQQIIRVLIEHVCDYPNVIGFQLDNETKSYGTAGPRVQKMFVNTLKEKFPDIQSFNTKFGLDYWSNRVNNWDDFPDILGTINQSLAAEFQKFQRSLVTEFLQWQSSLARKYAREDQFITQNFDFDWTSYSYGLQPEVDQYEAAQCMTVARADIYHPSQDLLTGAEITFCGNISRSLKNSNYLILETQAQGNIEWLPYPGQLRLQAYSHIANGSNSVMYWHWHSIHNAIESYWKGVLSHDFSENVTYQEASGIGAEWARIGKHLCNLTKSNSIAVVLDNASLTGLSHFPLENTGNHSYNAIVRWLCDALYRMNLEYDILPASTRDFSSYDCLVVPALYSAPEDLLYSIEQYVSGGGHLIATFRSGFSDENLKIYADTQPHVLHKCLGLHYDQFTYPKDVTVSQHPVREWMELVTCDTATPLLHYQHPVWGAYTAVATNQFRKGTTLYLASMLDESVLESCLKQYLQALPTPKEILSHPDLHFPLILKRGYNDLGKELYYYFNFSGEEISFSHSFSAGIELLSQQQVKANERITLPAWGLLIIES